MVILILFNNNNIIIIIYIRVGSLHVHFRSPPQPDPSFPRGKPVSKSSQHRLRKCTRRGMRERERNEKSRVTFWSERKNVDAANSADTNEPERKILAFFFTFKPIVNRSRKIEFLSSIYVRDAALRLFLSLCAMRTRDVRSGRIFTTNSPRRESEGERGQGFFYRIREKKNTKPKSIWLGMAVSRTVFFC